MKKKIIIIFIAVLCILYLTNFISFAGYESNIMGKINNKIASWNITLNDIDVTTTEVRNIALNDIEWTNPHTKDNKVSPGSVGIVRLVIDPNDTDVAIEYSLTVEDNTIDSDQILTVNNVRTVGSSIYANNNTYSGIIGLDDIDNERQVEILLDVEWVNDEDNNLRDSNVDDDTSFLKLIFNVKQYLGDDIDVED